MDPDPRSSSPDFPEPPLPPRVVRPPHVVTLVLLVAVVLLGIGGIAGNVQLAGESPVTTPTCNGVEMSPADSCEQDNYLNGSRTTTQFFSYDDMLAQEQPLTGFAPWGIAIGVALVGLGGWGMYRWFRKRRSYLDNA